MKPFYTKKLLFAALILATSFTACKKDQVSEPDLPAVTGKYAAGFFVIGEGSYGQSSGSINFYAYGADTLAIRAYEKENPGLLLSNSNKSSSLQFASIINGSIYLMCKGNGPIVKVNAYTLKEEGRYEAEGSNWRSILQVEENRGLISANDGVYQIDLSTITIGEKLNTLSASNSGEMLKKDQNIFVLQNNGAKVISSTDFRLIKSFSNINRGFAITPNGKVWAATSSRLIAIDNKLDTTGVALTASIGTSGLDAPTRITASTQENAIFYHAGKAIYKYIDGNPASVKQPFITITESPFMLYGAIRYDKNKDYLVVNGIQGYGAASTINYLLIYNASSGALVKRIKYGGDGITVDFSKIFFNDLAVFH